MSRSKYDSLTSDIVGKTINKWKGDFNNSLEEYSHFSININTKNIMFTFDARLFFLDKEGIEVLDSTGADARELDDDECYQTPFIDVDISINRKWLPTEWTTLYFLLCDIVRHEIEHITQEKESAHNYREGKPHEDDSIERDLIKSGMLPSYMYYMLPKEVDANLQGLRFERKKRKEPMLKTINRYLNNQELTWNAKKQILILWRKRAAKIGGIPIF